MRRERPQAARLVAVSAPLPTIFFALCTAVGCLELAGSLVAFADGNVDDPVLHAAMPAFLFWILITFLIGVTLLYIHASAPSPAAISTAAVDRLALVTLGAALMTLLLGALLLVAGVLAGTMGGASPLPWLF